MTFLTLLQEVVLLVTNDTTVRDLVWESCEVCDHIGHIQRNYVPSPPFSSLLPSPLRPPFLSPTTTFQMSTLLCCSVKTTGDTPVRVALARVGWGGGVARGWGHSKGVGTQQGGGGVAGGWGHSKGVGTQQGGGGVAGGWGHSKGVGVQQEGGDIARGWGHSKGVGV